jgi:hypothetical protein
MKPTSIMIHHNAVSHERNADQFKANNEYHRAKWNFKSSLGFFLGYNYEIAANGKQRQARIDGEQTAACYQKNMNSGQCLHICLDGNFDIEKPTPPQIYALRDFLKAKTQQYGIKKTAIYFHRQFAVKTCPGNNMDLEWVRDL